jgi:hypothetical protein
VSYSDLLRDPRWQRKRLEIMERDDWQCQECGDKATTLNVHHRRYVKGCKPWEYEDDDLVCLCQPCHGQITKAHAGIQIHIGRLDLRGLERVLGYVSVLQALNDRSGAEYEFYIGSEPIAQGSADAVGLSHEDMREVLAFYENRVTLEQIREREAAEFILQAKDNALAEAAR